MEKIRVRYAPSPTGYLHIGGARSALFNYLFAKKYGGDFVVRIEDTDIERNIEGAEESQINDLIWLNIIPDESPNKPNPKYAPYRQMEKLEIYRKYALELVEKGYAYYCYCSEDELAAMKEEQYSNGTKSFKYNRHCLSLSEEEIDKYKKEGRKPTIRLKMEKGIKLEFDDLVRGKMSFSSDDIGDFVIMKSNGIPTYNFAVVVDDHLMEISHVLRGEEHLSNTPKQLQIYEYFNWKPPVFGHMTIIINPNGKKLSKRDHNILQFMSQYKEMGYLPEAIDNFLFLLGYTSEDNREIFSLEEAIKAFNPQRLSSSPSMFDFKRLNYMNSYYIKHLSDEKYTELALPFLKQVSNVCNINIEKLKTFSLFYKNEIITFSDLTNDLKALLKPTYDFSEEEKELLKKESSNKVIDVFKEKINKLEVLDDVSIKSLFKEIQNETNIKGKDLYMPIRLKLTGKSHGLELFHILEIIGIEEVNKRL